MMIFGIYLVLCLWTFRSFGSKECSAVIEKVRICRERVQDGEIYLGSGTGDYLGRVIGEAEFAGLALGGSLQRLETQLVHVRSLLHRELRLYRLVHGKVGVILLASLLFRFFFAPVPGPYQVFDLFAQVLGGALLGCECYLARKFFNRGWFWQGKWTTEAKVWLNDLFLGDGNVVEAAEKKNTAQKHKLENFEECLPLVELLGAGLPALLNVFVPILAKLT